MNKKRPINLDLTTITFPITAITSILHRLSGVLLFLLSPLMLYCLKLSLSKEESFVNLQQILAKPLAKLVILLFLAALVYHILAGCRHLLMDCGVGEELPQGRFSAFFVIGCFIVLISLLGIWLW